MTQKRHTQEMFTRMDVALDRMSEAIQDLRSVVDQLRDDPSPEKEESNGTES